MGKKRKQFEEQDIGLYLIMNLWLDESHRQTKAIYWRVNVVSAVRRGGGGSTRKGAKKQQPTFWMNVPALSVPLSISPFLSPHRLWVDKTIGCTVHRRISTTYEWFTLDTEWARRGEGDRGAIGVAWTPTSPLPSTTHHRQHGCTCMQLVV